MGRVTTFLIGAVVVVVGIVLAILIGGIAFNMFFGAICYLVVMALIVGGGFIIAKSVTQGPA